MAGETTITVIGNLTDDPELRFTPSGAAVAKFRVASTGSHGPLTKGQRASGRMTLVRRMDSLSRSWRSSSATASGVAVRSTTA
jgi:hypothetical protein